MHFLDAISKLPRLETLELGGNCTNDDDISHVSAAFFVNLKSLSITNCEITDRSILALAQMKRKYVTTPRLETLILTGTRIRGTHIGKLIKRLPNLGLIGLDRTNLNTSGALSIAEALRNRKGKGGVSVRGLHVWMRNVKPPNSVWKPLLEFGMHNNPAQQFLVKHDLRC